MKSISLFTLVGASVLLGSLVACSKPADTTKMADKPVATTQSTLASVKEKGAVSCGVSGTVPGFSALDSQGKMQGIDAAICYAVAAAIFGDKDKAKFIPVTAKERFTALSSGEIDILTRNTTHTLTRDSSLGLNFTYYNYVDGQGFMVKKSLGVGSAKELDGARICVQAGTTTELNLADFFRSNGMKFTPINFDTSGQTKDAFEGGACDVLTSDKSQLAALRSELKDPNSAVILAETISKEPLGPVVRQGDDQWFNIVKWVLYALINAEELGITSKNIDRKLQDSSPAVKRLLGTEGNMGSLLGLNNDWAVNAIKAVGNYGEIYGEHVEPLGLARKGSVNDLWIRGGILYAPPVR